MCDLSCDVYAEMEIAKFAKFYIQTHLLKYYHHQS